MDKVHAVTCLPTTLELVCREENEFWAMQLCGLIGSHQEAQMVSKLVYTYLCWLCEHHA